MPENIVDKLRRFAFSYDLGYRNGLEAYAYWKDGIQYVGTNGRTLDEAVAERKTTWNYGEQNGR